MLGPICVVAAAVAAPTLSADPAWDRDGSETDPWASAGSERRGSVALPLRFVDRPLVLPRKAIRVEFELGGAVPTSTQGVVRIELGARVGVTDYLEIDFRLLRADLSPIFGFGLDQPRVTARTGFRLGPWEGAAELGFEVPVGSEFAMEGGLRSRLHAGPLRWDLSATAATDRRVVPEGAPDLEVRTALFLQPHPMLFLGPSAELRTDLIEADAGQVRVGGELGFTFGTGGRPVWELSARVWSGEFGVWGPEPPPPRFGRTWSGGLRLGLFFRDQSRDPFAGDPFFDD
jgi:hypothetical protein